jgi:hypothetical protein
VDPTPKAASRKDVSILRGGGGPDPTDGALARILLAVSTCIDGVRCTEVLDYSDCDQAMTLFDLMGFGRALDDVPTVMRPGVLTKAWGSAVRSLASRLGIQIDSLEERLARLPAPESFEVRSGTIEAGTVAALHLQLRGVRDGASPVVFEHVARLRPDLGPGWPQPGAPGCFQVRVSGDPSYTLDLPFGGGTRHGSEVLKTTAMRLVSAVPAAVAAPPGLLTVLALPLTAVERVAPPTVR